MCLPIIGALAGLVALLPLGMAPFGAACGLLLGVYAALVVRADSADPDLPVEVAASAEYRLGVLAVAAIAVGIVLVVIIAGAAAFASS